MRRLTPARTWRRVGGWAERGCGLFGCLGYAILDKQTMNIKKALYIGIISVFLLTASNSQAAQASSSDNRYFIKSTSQLWAKSFNARRHFDGGFTADLSDFQLKLAKMFGLEVEPVRKLTILLEPAQLSGPSRTPKPSKGPTSQIPWGVRMIYDDSALTKTSGGENIKVAILDTGIDKAHPDLKNRVSSCKDFSSASSPLIDGKCDDRNGHGTHVAGIIAADGGLGKGIYGMAPQTSVLAYKACGNNGSCYADDIAAGLRDAADSGAQVINLSLGSDAEIPFIADAVSYAVGKGVIVVAAAGNDGPYQDSIDFPASLVKAISVGAIDSSVAIPDWSARGNNSLSVPYLKESRDMEFAAPGVSVESTWPGGGYSVLSGTSMSAPHISGFIAKMWQVESEDPAAATRDLLHRFSQDIGITGDDDASGWGVPIL